MAERAYLLVPADPSLPVTQGRAVTDLDTMKDLIGGGWLEAVSGDDFTAYLDEEGKIKGLPYNPRATALVERLGRPLGSDIICGDVVLFGSPDDEGYDTDIPQRVIDVAGLTG